MLEYVTDACFRPLPPLFNNCMVKIMVSMSDTRPADCRSEQFQSSILGLQTTQSQKPSPATTEGISETLESLSEEVEQLGERVLWIKAFDDFLDVDIDSDSVSGEYGGLRRLLLTLTA